MQAMDLTVPAGEICGLIGPNGAGKTTLFNCVTRNVQPASGSITFDGKNLLGEKPSSLARAGIKRTFQNLALFDSMDVRSNVMVGAHSTGKVGWLRAAARAGVGREERRIRKDTDEVLELLELTEVADAKISDLPFGTQKRIELARALVSRPRLLLLDEPANGLREAEVDQLGELLLRVRDDFGLTLVIVEHHVGLVMRLCDSVAAMAAGKLITQGKPHEVRAHPEVLRVFLGESA